MTTKIIAGLPWRIHSPSLIALEHIASTGTHNILVGFNGQTWQVGVDNVYGTREWPTRDAAAATVADAFAQAMLENAR